MSDIINKTTVIKNAIDKIPYLELITNSINNNIYIAGGGLRDILRNKKIKDVDLFIDGIKSDNIIELLTIYGEVTYTPFKSIRWYPKKNNFYFDIVYFEDIKLGFPTPTTINELLNQFDITINAVGFDLKKEILYDPINGLSDLEKKIIRTIRIDFSKNPILGITNLSPYELLWFRIIYMKYKLNYSLDIFTSNWIISNQNILKKYQLYNEFIGATFLSKDIIKSVIQKIKNA